MAKINIEFDTKSKTCSVLFDGQNMDNVQSVNIFKDSRRNEAFIEITLFEDKTDENGTSIFTRVMASDNLPRQPDSNIEDINQYSNEDYSNRLVDAAFKLLGKQRNQ